MKWFIKLIEKLLDGMFGPKQVQTFWALDEFKKGMDEMAPKVEAALENFDTNEFVFLTEDLSKLWYCPKHMFRLDSVQPCVHDEGDTTYMFSCKNEREDGQTCWASKVIDHGEFWLGIKKPEERWVDPEWLENYEAHIYNQNMRAFERAMAFPSLIHIPH